MKKILQVRKMEKTYGKRGNITKAVDGISFDVVEGEYIGIMGASGSGKTTLLNCISTIDSVTGGAITIKECDVTSLSSKKLSAFRREQLGFIFQDFNLLDTLTAFENIALALTIMKCPAGEIQKRVEEVAEKLEIQDVLSKYPYQMSGGQKQRVAAARAIVTKPAMILADEPTGALDSKSAKMLLKSFEKMNEEMNATILMVTHDAFTASYCRRILFIKDGRLFHEIDRGKASRKDFFNEIIDVVSVLGGTTAMYFRLARKNVRKSIRDFTVYFLTLVLGVCVFYMFNSLDAQQELMAFTESRQATLVALTEILAYFSGFVSVVLGFLVVYANGFLIRRRKRELGMYMLLGMEKWKIARVLVYETMIIGVVALAVGLGIGVLLSQLMSVFTAMLFEVNMTGFHFVFSFGGAAKAMLYFGVIFLIAVLFSAVSISRYKLIDLFQAGKKNQELKIRSMKASVVLFLASVVCLGAAYALILENGLLKIGWMFTASILLGCIGTFLFFMSLSGFLLRTVQANKKMYFRNLNMFVLRQVNSKINTTYASMTIVCLVLLLTIGTFSSGIGVSMAVSEDMAEANPYDYSITRYQSEREETELSLMTVINERFGNGAYQDAVEIHQYNAGITLGELNEIAGGKLDFKEMSELSTTMISLSEVNALRRMNQQPEISLDKGTFVLVCTNGDFQNLFSQVFDATHTLAIGGLPFELQGEDMIQTQLTTGSLFRNFGVFVLRDEEMPIAALEIQSLNMNFETEEQSKAFQKEMGKWYAESNTQPFHRAISKEDIYEAGVSTRTILSFLAIYLGFVFLITCAAILALQQLSEASENRERYELLRKIGAEKRMVNQAIFFQVFLYFMMPLGLAIVHSIVGLKVANDVIRLVGEMDIVGNLVVTALFILVIYGGYFLATYYGVKAIVAPQSGRIRE